MPECGRLDRCFEANLVDRAGGTYDRTLAARQAILKIMLTALTDTGNQGRSRSMMLPLPLVSFWINLNVRVIRCFLCFSVKLMMKSHCHDRY